MKKRIGLFIFAALFFAVPAFASINTDIQLIERAQAYVNVQESASITAREIGVFHMVARNSAGEILWTEDAENTLANDGQQHFLDVYLRNGTAVTNFYIGLTDNTSTCSIAKADTLTTVVAYVEPSTNGYARSLVERSATGWPTLALDAGDYMATSSVETFTATGGSWGPVYCAFVTDVVSGTAGKHISWAALSTGRTLQSGDSLQVTYKIKLQ